MVSNQFEIDFNRLLALENPTYFQGLEQILWDYQKILLDKGIVQELTFESIAELLQNLKHNKHIAFEMDYDLDRSVNKLRNETLYEQSILKIIRSISKYNNIENSKTFHFNQQLGNLVSNNTKLTRSQIAEVLLESFDSIDFDLLTIKLMFFRFLDPKSNFHIYKYVGRPINPDP